MFYIIPLLALTLPDTPERDNGIIVATFYEYTQLGPLRAAIATKAIKHKKQMGARIALELGIGRKYIRLELGRVKFKPK